MKDEGIDKFISIYGKDLGSFKELEIEGCFWCLGMKTRTDKQSSRNSSRCHF